MKRHLGTDVWGWLRIAVVALVLIPSAMTCGGSRKGPAYLGIRDIRYSKELAIELIQPDLQRRTWEFTDPEILTTEETMEVQGRIRSRKAKLRAFVNGEVYEVAGPDERAGTFSIKDIPLQVGKNEIVITATEGTKSNEERFEIIRTEQASKITLSSPKSGDYMRERWVTVEGEAALEMEKLQINGIAAVRENEESSRFSAKGVILKDGENLLVVTGRDEEDRIWRTTASVLRDVKAPQLEIIYPPENTVTNQPLITLEGKIDDPAAKFEINGEPVSVDAEGNFTKDVPIDGLEGRFDFYAVDKVGNETRVKRVVKIDNTRPGITVTSPKSGVVVGELPLTMQVLASKTPARLEILLDGESIAKTDLNSRETSYQLKTIDVPDGAHELIARIHDDAGNTADQKLKVVTDLREPTIRIDGISDGISVERTTIRVDIEDPSLVRNSVEITINGKRFKNGSTLDYRKHGSGKMTLRVAAADRAGRKAVQEVHFDLERNYLKSYMAELEKQWRANNRRSRGLVDPLIADLKRVGAWKELTATYDAISEDMSANPPRATDPDIVRAFKAFELIYPEPYEMDELRTFYEASRDLARHGVFRDFAEVIAEANRLGAWQMTDAMAEVISKPDSSGHSLLTDIIWILDVFARYPKQRQMFAALVNLPKLELDLDPKTKEDFFDIPLELLETFFDQPKSDFEGLINYQSKIVNTGAHKLGPRGFYEAIEFRGGSNLVQTAYEPLSCILDEKKDRPYDRLLKSWAVFIHEYLKDDRRFKITQGVMKIAKSALENDVLDSASILMNYEEIPQMHEAFQVLSEREVFDKAMTDLGKILAAKDNEGRPVTYSLLIALDGFFEKDEVHPQQNYAETMLDGVERLLQRDKNGLNSLEIVLDIFLDKLTQEQRLRFGEVFKYHTLPDGKKVLARGRKFPSDNQRLLKLMDIAYSPLDCGAPIAFTDHIITINMPGMPIKFPSKNIAIDAFEASAELEAGTAAKLAGLFDFLAATASIGDLFCEPDILADLVADPAPIKALLRETPLEEAFTMIQALAKRGDAPYLVEMIHSLYLSGASGLFDPTMNAVFEQGVIENSIAVLRAVRDARLSSDPNRKALSVFLDFVAFTLREPPNRRHRLVRPFLLLLDRIISQDEMRQLIQTQLNFVADVLNDPPPGLNLHELDNLAGEMYGCDKNAKATRAFAKMLDDNPKNGDFRYLLKHARTYLDAPAELAVAFNAMIADVLDKGLATELLFTLQQWAKLDQRYDFVLEESLANVLRPNKNDWAALDPLLYGILKTSAPVIIERRTQFKEVLAAKNRPVLRKLMGYPFKAMELDGKNSYMERMVPAARIFMESKAQGARELYMNDISRGFHVLLREHVTRALANSHEQAYKLGYYNPAREPDLLEAFADVLDESLRKWGSRKKTSKAPSGG